MLNQGNNEDKQCQENHLKWTMHGDHANLGKILSFGAF